MILISLTLFVAFYIVPIWGNSYDQFDSFTDNLLREVLSRIGGPDDIPHSLSGEPEPTLNDYPGRGAFEARRDTILNREPSIRDQEYLEHSSLFGNQYAQGEGLQRHKPDGSMINMQLVKDGALPGYCIPPNPCPIGYTAEDGCLENFDNTAAFSQEYQASQQCMCDSEHMFDCPGSTQENEIDALARTFENEGLAEVALDRLIKTMEIEGEHTKVVAKKFFSQKPLNPFLEGEKLPVVAKKAPRPAMK